MENKSYSDSLLTSGDIVYVVEQDVSDTFNSDNLPQQVTESGVGCIMADANVEMTSMYNFPGIASVKEHSYVQNCGIPTSFVALPRQDLTNFNENDSHVKVHEIEKGAHVSNKEIVTGNSLTEPSAFIRVSSQESNHGNRPLAQGSPVRWLRQRRDIPATITRPQEQVYEYSLGKTRTFPSAPVSNREFPPSSAVNNMAAPMAIDDLFETNNLQRLQTALGINDILNSIQLLHDNSSNSRKRNTEVRNDEETPPIKRKKDIEHSPDVGDLSESEADESEEGQIETEIERQQESSRFESAFSKDTLGKAIQDNLATVLSKSCTSAPDANFVKEVKEKFQRPENTPYLVVPRINSSIYRKMSRHLKDGDHSLQRPQGVLCHGIYAVAQLSDKLQSLKADNPGNDVLEDLHSLSEDAAFLLGHASYLLSIARREKLKHLFVGDYTDLCKKSQDITDELFGSDLTKTCKDIGEAAKATNQIMKKSGQFSFGSKIGNNSFRHRTNTQTSNKVDNAVDKQNNVPKSQSFPKNFPKNFKKFQSKTKRKTEKRN